MRSRRKVKVSVGLQVVPADGPHSHASLPGGRSWREEWGRRLLPEAVLLKSSSSERPRPSTCWWKGRPGGDFLSESLPFLLLSGTEPWLRGEEGGESGSRQKQGPGGAGW